MRDTAFIRPNLTVDLLKVDDVAKILPTLRAAAAARPDDAARVPEIAQRF